MTTIETPPRSVAITVALVTWNCVAHVVELVKSLLVLARDPLEIVVVDNASTDGTREVLREVAGIRLIENETNRRCAAATNQAIAACRTSYLVYLCSAHAVVTEPGWDQVLVRFMEEHPGIPLAGDVWNPYGFMIESRRYRVGWSPERHGRDRLLHVQGGAWIARRCIFEDVGGFAADEHPHGGMDVEFSYRLLSNGYLLGHHPAIACPPSPEEPVLREGVVAYHPASPRLRHLVRDRLGVAGRTALPSAVEGDRVQGRG